MGLRIPHQEKELCGVRADFLDHFEPIVEEFNRLLSGNKIFIERLANVAVVSKEDALSYNLVGPNLRASGVALVLTVAKKHRYQPGDRVRLALDPARLKIRPA